LHPPPRSSQLHALPRRRLSARGSLALVRACPPVRSVRSLDSVCRLAENRTRKLTPVGIFPLTVQEPVRRATGTRPNKRRRCLRTTGGAWLSRREMYRVSSQAAPVRST
jgi:hypothetical protein